MRITARVLSFVLLGNGVEHIAPFLPWWASFLACMSAFLAANFGFTGRVFLEEAHNDR